MRPSLFDRAGDGLNSEDDAGHGEGVVDGSSCAQVGRDGGAPGVIVAVAGAVVATLGAAFSLSSSFNTCCCSTAPAAISAAFLFSALPLLPLPPLPSPLPVYGDGQCERVGS